MFIFPLSWYPPGHGDFYESLYRSGNLDKLISRGVEWAFVSNIDNLGSNPDPEIIKQIQKLHEEQGINFVSEVIRKTLSDVKGGVFVKIDDQIRLLECAQIPEERVIPIINEFFNFLATSLWF